MKQKTHFHHFSLAVLNLCAYKLYVFLETVAICFNFSYFSLKRCKLKLSFIYKELLGIKIHIKQNSNFTVVSGLLINRRFFLCSRFTFDCKFSRCFSNRSICLSICRIASRCVITSFICNKC